jgi:anti-anti-sigma factor
MAIIQSAAGMPSLTPKGAGNIPQIEVGVTEAPGEMIVRIAGKGCVSQADALAARLLRLSARRSLPITLDLSGLTCVSCLAMGVLVRFRQGVVRAGGHVRLVTSLQEPVREALDRAGLLPLLGSPEGVRSGQELPRNLEAMPSNPVPPLNPRTAELSLA